MAIKQLSLILLSLTYSTFTVTSEPNSAAQNQNNSKPVTLTPRFRSAKKLLNLEQEKAYLQYCHDKAQQQGRRYELSSIVHLNVLTKTCMCMDALNETDREALTNCYMQAPYTLLGEASLFVQEWDNTAKKEIDKGLDKAEQSINEINRRLDKQEFVAKKFS